MSNLSRWEIAANESLTLEEEAEKLRLERKVERAFYEAGLALKTLRDKRLWRGTHCSFEIYCQERFNYSRSYCFRLIQAVEIVDNLSDNVANWQHLSNKILPKSESQCRPLKALNPEQQRIAWTKAVSEANGIPTAKIVKDVVNRMKKGEITVKDLERQRFVTDGSNVTAPREGCNLISGTGLDWYVRVDEETFKRLDGFAEVNGIPSLGLAVRRLLGEVKV